MYIKFEPSGTHVHKDHLKVRLDFFPDPADKAKTKKGTKNLDALTKRQVLGTDVGKSVKEVNDRGLYQAVIDAEIFSGTVE